MKTKRGRQLWALVAAVAFVSIALLASAFEQQPTEDKVAVGNGSVITQEDVDREMSRVQQRLLSMGKPLIDSQIPEIHECKVRYVRNVYGKSDDDIFIKYGSGDEQSNNYLERD